MTMNELLGCKWYAPHSTGSVLGTRLNKTTRNADEGT